jgi:predicted acetyltransferase/8-oxo-dGTP pyrophosphatase MutT (NUDIX family)
LGELTLRALSARDEEAFFAGLREWDGEELYWYTFAWKPGMPYAEMLRALENETAGRNLGPGRVPHTMLYAFLDGRIIGRVSVRHALNERLRARGGHVGYAVAPAFRRRGYARELLRMGLEYCRRIGLARVMITCGEGNEPSWKLIERAGGRLEDTAWDEAAGETIRRYWVELATDGIEKVLVYVLRGAGEARELLVFDQPSEPGAGTQVPGGTVDEGESPEAAALRELEEESGLSLANPLYLGAFFWHRTDRPELHRRHVYLLHAPPALPDAWDHVVTQGAEDKGMVFRYRWVPLAAARELLAVDRGAYTVGL